MTEYRPEIKIYTVSGSVWFCAKDVAKALKYKNTNVAIREHVESKNKSNFGILFKGDADSLIQNKTIYINKAGLTTLLIASRMPNKCNFINWCSTNHNIDLLVLTRLDKEQETIGQIIKVFNYKTHHTQFTVDIYRLDLYFPDDKLAIECDEFGHRGRDQEYERARETHIKNKLNCKFVRYNPDEPNFSVFDVIRRIIAELYERNSTPAL